MAEAKGRFDWLQTSSIMALIANLNRDSKSDPIPANAFSPYEQASQLSNNDVYDATDEVIGKHKFRSIFGA